MAFLLLLIRKKVSNPTAITPPILPPMAGQLIDGLVAGKSFGGAVDTTIKLPLNPSTATANLLSQVVTKYRTTKYFPPDLSVSSVL